MHAHAQLKMKTIPISLCFTLIVSISIAHYPSATAQDFPVVLDIDGNQVRAGVDYYILPAVRGQGGGLTLDSVGDELCPLTVFQEASEVENGLPVTFSPVDNSSLVRESTDQNVQFSAGTICVQSTLWQLHRGDSSGKFYVGTGGTLGNPGLETVSNWFKIEKFGQDYKLVFCPTVCDVCRVICKDLSILIQENGKRRLGLDLNSDDSPFAVSFKKA